MTKIHLMAVGSAIALLALIATEARADYAASCAGCHAASGPGSPEVNFLPNSTGSSGSIRAANNLAYLNTKTTAGMGGATTLNLTTLQRQAIVDEIGASASVAAPVFTSSSAPGGSMTFAYSHTFTASGAPTLVGNLGLSAPFTLATGALPSGLTLNASSGLLSGTPTLSGTFTGTIRASNLVGTAPTQSFTITISKLAQATLTAIATPSTVAYLGTSTLSTTGGTGTGAVTYSSNSLSCTISGSTLTAQSGTGSCTITATKAADTNYLVATGTVIVTLTKLSQTISFGAQVPLTRAFSAGGTFPINPLASGGASANAVTYSSLTSGICTVSSTTVTIAAVGTCTIAANQAGDTNYLPATQVTQNVAIGLASQTITFGAQTPSSQVFSPLGTFAINPLASGGASMNPIIYTSPSTGICSVSGTTVTIQSAGSCIIAADQAGDALYAAASQVTRTVTVNQASQTISFGAQVPLTQAFSTGGAFPINPLASGGASMNAVTYSSLTSSICTVSSTTVTIVAVGTCTIAANQAGNTNYFAAIQATQNVVISQASQTITFGVQISPITFSAGGSFAISPVATGGASSSPVVYSSTTTGVCTVNGTTVLMVSAGVCTLAANQAAGANYSAALQVTQNVTINATVPDAPTIGIAVSGDARATIIFTAPASNGGSAITSYTATCTPTGTGTSTAPPITVTGLTNATTYTCSVYATNAIGNSAASGTVTVTPVKGSVLVPIIDFLFD